MSQFRSFVLKKCFKRNNPPSWQRDALMVLVLGVVFAGVRSVYFSAYINNMPFALRPLNDAYMYWNLGVEILREGWLLPNHGPYYQAPLYPYVLAALHTLGYHRVIEALAGQMLLGVMNGVLVYGMSRLLLPRSYAACASLMYGLSHYPLFFESKILAFTVGQTLMLGFALFYLLWLRFQRYVWVISAGLLFALTVLCRPNWLFAFPLVLLHLYVYGSKISYPWISWPRLAPAFVFLAVFAIGVSPAPLRNGLVGGDAVFISANSGVTLYMGTNPNAQGGLGAVPGLSNNIDKQSTQSVELASQQAGEALSPSQASRFWVQKTLSWIVQHPVDYLVLQGKKMLWAFYYTPPAVNYSTHFERTFIPWLGVLQWFSAAVIALGWCGLPFLWCKNDAARLFCLAMLGSYFLLVWAFYASDRFLAAQLPFLSIAAMRLIQTLRQTEWRPNNRLVQWRSMKSAALITWLALVLFLTVNPFLSWNADKEIGMGYYNLGIMRMMQERPDAARQSFERGLQYTPNAVPMLLNLGVLYAQNNQFEESNRLFERVLELDPSNRNAQRNLEINRRRMQGAR